MLGSEPIEEEIPVSRNDLALETQMVFDLYDKLPAKWEGFSGQYLGKDLVILPILFDEYKIDSSIRKYAWDIIPLIDRYISEDLAQKAKSKIKGEMPGGNGK